SPAPTPSRQLARSPIRRGGRPASQPEDRLMDKRALSPATLELIQAVRTTADPERPWLVAVSGRRESLALAAAARLARAAAVRATSDPERPWLVAVSGGRHSLALAAAARLPRADAVRAVVVDHGLQADSAQGARRTVSQLEGLGLSADLVRVTVASPRGPEAAARAARYEALSTATGDGAQVLLGHTMDDQTETVLLAMTRGSGVRSLAGMAPVT